MPVLPKYALCLSTGLVIWLSSCSYPSNRHDQSATPIKEIKEDFRAGHSGRVRFEGVVTVENPNFGFFVVQDETAGIRVQPAQFRTDSLLGHKVEIVGSLPTVSGTDAISDGSVTDLGAASLPAPAPITAANVNAADVLDGQLVSLSGTARFGRVDAAGQLVLPVRVGGFEVSARFMYDIGLDVDQFVDSEVRVIGVASTGIDIRGQLTDLTILAANRESISVSRPAPDPTRFANPHCKKRYRRYKVVPWITG